jgi:predicted nucleic acid-binding protein
MSFVLDTSVTMAWLFEDEASASTEALLDRLVGEEAVVPPLWSYEVANVLVMAERRQRVNEAQARGFAALLTDLPIRVSGVGTSDVWSGPAAVARAHGLSAYDAAYLDLAMREGLSLATRDAALQRAAATAGVEVL